jgi:hypothetical protein
MRKIGAVTRGAPCSENHLRQLAWQLLAGEP